MSNYNVNIKSSKFTKTLESIPFGSVFIHMHSAYIKLKCDTTSDAYTCLFLKMGKADTDFYSIPRDTLIQIPSSVQIEITL